MESRLGVTVVRTVDSFVCHFDSSGLVPQALPGIGQPVPAKQLRRLFRGDRGSRLTTVSLRNSNLGARALRARTMSASSIEDSAPSLDDRAFACMTALGYSRERSAGGVRREEVVRRYVGFLHGRITDASAARATFGDYVA